MEKKETKRVEETHSPPPPLSHVRGEGNVYVPPLEQQALSVASTNIVINFNFLNLFGHQRPDWYHLQNKAVRVSGDVNGLKLQRYTLCA